MQRILCGILTLGLALALTGLLRADDAADMKALVDKAIKAHGGADKINKYKGTTLKMKGKVHAMGAAFEYTGEVLSQAPDKFKLTIDTEIMGQKFQQVQVLNGDKGWVFNSIQNQTTELDKDMMAEAREELYAGAVETLVPLTGKEYKLSPLGEVKVGDRTTTGVRVSQEGHRDINLFFDKEKHQLLKVERTVKDFMAGGQEVRQETIYSDYKDVEGVATAHKFDVKRDGKDFVDGELTEVKLHEKLDDSLFTKP
jgi:outer membrane lipoprotein-sorting protein